MQQYSNLTHVPMRVRRSVYYDAQARYLSQPATGVCQLRKPVQR